MSVLNSMNDLASPAIAGGSRLWSSTGALSTGRSSTRSSEVTFVRRVDAQFAVGLERLEQWWRASAQHGAVNIARSRLIVPITTTTDDGRCTIDVVLGRGPIWPELTM